MSSPLRPTEHFNALSEEEKKRVLSDGLGVNLLHSGLPFAIPLWWRFMNHETGLGLRNGSAFLVDLGHGIFAVTAAHVFREYLNTKRAAVAIGCQLGHALFDPEAQLIGCRDDLDIATFRVSSLEAKQIGKAVVTSGPPNWEPLNPAVGNFAFFAGFPAQTRGMTVVGDFDAVPYFAMPPITSVTERQITCRFNREKIIDFSGSGLPPQGYDIGGSDGPLLVPTLVCQGAVEGKGSALMKPPKKEPPIFKVMIEDISRPSSLEEEEAKRGFLLGRLPLRDYLEARHTHGSRPNKQRLRP